MRIVSITLIASAALLSGPLLVLAEGTQEDEVYNTTTASTARKTLWSGDWYLKVGAAGLVAPKFQGSNKYRFFTEPLISFGRQGEVEHFSSRNDNMEIALIEADRFSAGAVGKLLFKRDADIEGLNNTKFGGEIGGFVEVYPMDWLRVRGELRHGVVAHNGVVGELSADAFYDVTPIIRVSAGPRASFASKDYFRTYYGVTEEESLASGLKEYRPGSGLGSVGLGGAVNWKATDKIDTSLFAEYERLQGPARDSSIVKDYGSPNVFSVGVSATYRFDFSLD